MKRIVLFSLCVLLFWGCTSKHPKVHNHTTGIVIGSMIGVALGGMTGGMLGFLASGNETGVIVGLLVGAVSGGMTGGALGNGVSEVLTTQSE